MLFNNKVLEAYEAELIENLEGREVTPKNLLNGASDWVEYSFSGCSLCYNADIADRLGLPLDTDDGLLLNLQAQALELAAFYILLNKVYEEIKELLKSRDF